MRGSLDPHAQRKKAEATKPFARRPTRRQPRPLSFLVRVVGNHSRHVGNPVAEKAQDQCQRIERQCKCTACREPGWYARTVIFAGDRLADLLGMFTQGPSSVRYG